MKNHPRVWAMGLAVLSGAVSFAATGLAVDTSAFRLDSYEQLSGGELDGAMVHSSGVVDVGVSAERVEVAASVARCAVRFAGRTIVGTGQEGKLFALSGDEAVLFAETGQPMVTACTVIGDTLFAGTMPEGRLFAISSAGEVRELVQLEAQHIWSLVEANGQLYAGTGPEGQVFSVAPASGRAELRLDTDEAHVLSLAADGNVVFAGTDGEALLYRLEGSESAVLHDFPGNEVAALAYADGVLVAAVNDMPAPRPVRSTKAPTKNATPRPGKGRLYRLQRTGDAERVLSNDRDHFTSVALNDGAAYVGSGHEGRVYRVDDARNVATWLDVDERQVLAILFGEEPMVATGDSAAAYRLRVPERGVWISKVLDAGAVARFGRLDWRGDGALRFSTRSGNVGEPGDGWTDWSAASRSPGPVRSPSGRYVQVRAELESGASIRGVDLYYLPANRRAILGAVGLKAPSKKQARRAVREPSTVVQLDWSVDNPDGDALRFRLRYRADGSGIWRPMFDEQEVLTDSHYSWNTAGLPDGLYVVEVVASDEPANPGTRALRDRRTSEAIVVDNHAPDIVSLALRGRSLQGSVRDSLGPIARLEWSLDGGPFVPIASEDGLLDEAEERFVFEIPDTLQSGPHYFAVRARDRAGNARVAEVEGTLR
ncbi:MAG: hypothetical protein AAF938_26755 [Myxococcota bacterium]